LVTEEDLYRERLRLALDAAGLDLWENDLATGEVTQRVSRVLADLGYDDHESIAYMDDLFALVHPDDLAGVKQAISAHIAGNTEQYRCEFRLRGRDGGWVWYANYGRIMKFGDHNGKRFIGVTFDIDDRKRREDEVAELNKRLAEQNAELARVNEALQMLATTDALTALANRRLLIETGEKECRRAPRVDQPLSLLILDIDHFKRVNDSWGHPAGDKVLCAIADLCRSRFRQGMDVVARIGGEEFAILMPATPYDEAMRIAQWLREAVAEHRIELGPATVVACTVSIGVATMPRPQAAAETSWNFDYLLVSADRALYRAKEAGRNQVQGMYDR